MPVGVKDPQCLEDWMWRNHGSGKRQARAVLIGNTSFSPTGPTGDGPTSPYQSQSTEFRVLVVAPRCCGTLSVQSAVAWGGVEGQEQPTSCERSLSFVSEPFVISSVFAYIF